MKNVPVARGCLALLTLLCLPSIVTARVRPGVEVGVSATSLAYENDNQFPYRYWDRKWRPSFTGGATLEIPFRERIGIVLGLRYLQQGNKADFDYSPSGFPVSGKIEFIHSYISIPVLLSFRPLPSPRIVFTLGPEVAYLLSARSISESNDLFSIGNTADIKDNMDPVNLSLDGGIGFEFPIENHVATLGVRYSNGIFGVAKDDDWASDWKTRSIETLVGMKW